MRRDYAVILAVLLILVGVIIFGVATVRVWQEGSALRMDIDTQQNAALDTGLLGTPTAPLLAGVESGSMALGTPQPPLVAFAAAGGAEDAPQEPVITILPVTVEPTLDSCPPQAESGFPADAAVTAIGSLRLYSEPDVLSPALGEFGAGQAFLVTADTGGVTAIRRCDLVWVRVRLTGGSMGWVLASAIVIGQPTAQPTLAPTASPPICPGGCGTPTPCWNPCSNPCNQPCNDPCSQPCAQQGAQPCTQPCGVYSQ